MPVIVIPTDEQVAAFNLERIRKLVSERLPCPPYYTRVFTSQPPWDFHSPKDPYDLCYNIFVGRPPETNTYTVKRGFFKKPIIESTRRCQAIAYIEIKPDHLEKSEIILYGSEEENKILLDLIAALSTDWMFKRGNLFNLDLEVNILPEEKNNYFALDHQN